MWVIKQHLQNKYKKTIPLEYVTVENADYKIGRY